MYRIVITVLLRSLLLGIGLVLFFKIGRDRTPWTLSMGFVAAITLVGFIRMLPLLRMESEIKQRLRGSGMTRDALEAELGHKREPVVSLGTLGMVAFLCLAGLVLRFLK